MTSSGSQARSLDQGGEGRLLGDEPEQGSYPGHRCRRHATGESEEWMATSDPRQLTQITSAADRLDGSDRRGRGQI